MELFADVTSDPVKRQIYLEEKASYVSLIKERAEIFVSEAQAVGLDLYPYKEGFFATIRTSSDKETERLNLLLQTHHIYTVEVHKGLRIALCSVPKAKLYGLAARIKTIIS